MPPIRSIARYIFNELRKPYGYAGMVWALALLLFLGGALWQLGEWLADYLSHGGRWG